MAYVNDGTGVSRPWPKSKVDRERWEWQSLRHRIMTGEWQSDGNLRMAQFYHPDVRDLLPDAETSCNPAASFIYQISTLFDDDPIVQVDSDPDLSALALMALWGIGQEHLINVQSMLEGLIRFDWDLRHERARYRPITPDCIVAQADPLDPSRPVYIEELRPRKGQWTWETWDVRDEERPAFKIELDLGKDIREDITAAVLADEPGFVPGEYPRRDRDGRPILPYELFHRSVGSRLWSPPIGQELFAGTLTASGLWTGWLGGVRDNAAPARAIVDGTIMHTSAAQRIGPGQRQAVFSPFHVLEIMSKGEGRSAQLASWPATMDPEGAGRAIAAFIAQLALYAGISPADATISSAGLSRTSGFAIQVSREGQRRARRRIRRPMSTGLAHLLANTARMTNQITGQDLPEDPDEYSISFAELDLDQDEQKALTERAAMLLEKGLITRVGAIRMVHPQLSEEQALQMLINISTEAATLAAMEQDATGPSGPVGSGVAPEKAQDTALNGAQVTSATQIVQAVAAGELPRESGVAMLGIFFNLAPADADAVMGEVGRSFIIDRRDTSAGRPAFPGAPADDDDDADPGGPPAAEPDDDDAATA